MRRCSCEAFSDPSRPAPVRRRETALIAPSALGRAHIRHDRVRDSRLPPQVAAFHAQVEQPIPRGVEEGNRAFVVLEIEDSRPQSPSDPTGSFSTRILPGRRRGRKGASEDVRHASQSIDTGAIADQRTTDDAAPFRARRAGRRTNAALDHHCREQLDNARAERQQAELDDVIDCVFRTPCLRTPLVLRDDVASAVGSSSRRSASLILLI